MVKKIIINDLFNIQGNNKTILFNEDLTILVGKNGSGKTTILNIINIIITKNFTKLIPYKFSSIELYSDSGNVVINRTREEIIIKRSDIKISKELLNKASEIFSIKEKEKSIYIKIPLSSERYAYRETKSFDLEIDSIYFPTYRRMETTLFKLLSDKFEKGYFTSRMIEEIEYDFNESSNTVIGFSNKDVNRIILDKWRDINAQEKIILNNMFKEFLFSFFSSRNISQALNIVDIKPDELKKNLLEILYRTKLVPETDNSITEIEKYIENLIWANERLKSGSKANNLEGKPEDFEKAVGFIFNNQAIQVLLTIYKDKRLKIGDIYEPLTSFINTLQLFLDKRVEINEGDLRFLEKDNILHYENLSAGEKQLVAIFLYIRFIKPSAVILIDEPELSLHINWQRKFLTALVDEKIKSQYIISTHSPFIISNYRDKIFVLGEMDETEYGE